MLRLIVQRAVRTSFESGPEGTRISKETAITNYDFPGGRVSIPSLDAPMSLSRFFRVPMKYAIKSTFVYGLVFVFSAGFVS